MNETSGDSRPTVLLVDDNSTNLEVLFATLKGSDLKLIAARNGEQAIRLARRRSPTSSCST